MSRDATLATLCSELILLTFMLTGLVRQRDHYLGRLLFHHVNALFDGFVGCQIADIILRQGVIWLLVAIFAQVPLIVSALILIIMLILMLNIIT
jgi:hypothetical protein